VVVFFFFFSILATACNVLGISIEKHTEWDGLEKNFLFFNTCS